MIDVHKNLWPEFVFDEPAPGEVVERILHTQAQIITDQTNGLLRGKVQVARDLPALVYRLLVIVPGLDYHLFVLTIANQLDSEEYVVRDDVNEVAVSLAGPESLSTVISNILKHDKVVKLVKRLYASAAQAAARLTPDEFE